MMAVAIAGTLYTTFCAFLVFPHLGAPPWFSRAALTLGAADVIAAIGWSATHQRCGGATSGDAVFNHPCPALTSALVSAVALLTGVFFAASVAYGVRAARGQPAKLQDAQPASSARTRSS